MRAWSCWLGTWGTTSQLCKVSVGLGRDRADWCLSQVHQCCRHRNSRGSNFAKGTLNGADMPISEALGMK